MTTLIIATRNTHKVAEIRAILGAGFNYRTLVDFPGAPITVEDAGTFAGNATKKALELARWLGSVPSSEFRVSRQPSFVLADDSGLEVDALDGAPGVHSARFAAWESGAAGNAPDAANNAKLLRLLADVPAERRTARFRCVLTMAAVEANQVENASPVCYAEEMELPVMLFDGVCEGQIQSAPAGGGGFGYDPLFVPTGFSESFAELGEAVKNRISHRAQALAQLKAWLAQSHGAHSPS